eukprot:114751_1
MGQIFQTQRSQELDPVTFKLEKADDITVKGAMSFQINGHIITFATISSVIQVHAISGDGMPHYGLIFQNRFMIDNRNKYNYLLVHALGQTNDYSKLKLDLLFTNKLAVAKTRLARLVSKTATDVISSEWEKVSKHANMQVIVNAFKELVNNEFDIKCEKDMALQKYHNKINCVLAAQHFYAVVMDSVPSCAMESWIEVHRGELLRRAGVAIADVETGVPCKGGEIFWKTKKETHTPEAVYRLQEHKSDEEMKMFIEDANERKMYSHPLAVIESAVVHDKKYRIIKKPVWNERDESSWVYDWRDIYRSDDLKLCDEEYEKLTSVVDCISEFVIEETVNPMHPPASLESKQSFRKRWEHDHKLDPRRGAVLMKVKPNSEEWMDVVTRMKCSSDRVVIINRIENPKVWNKYVKYTQSIGKWKEVQVWHGTRRTDPALICNDGFMKEFARVGECLWYAVDASYCMDKFQYSIGDSIAQVILSLVGGSDYGDIRYIRNNKVLCVYENAATYPAYLITYKKNKS